MQISCSFSSQGLTRSALSASVFPEPKAAKECVYVVPSSATGREMFHFPRVAPAKNHVVRMQSIDQSGHSVRHISFPFFLAKALQSSEADVVFVSAILERQVGKFHRDYGVFSHEGGA